MLGLTMSHVKTQAEKTRAGGGSRNSDSLRRLRVRVTPSPAVTSPRRAVAAAAARRGTEASTGHEPEPESRVTSHESDKVHPGRRRPVTLRPAAAGAPVTRGIRVTGMSPSRCRSGCFF
jgi:hypothetical protein